MSRTPRSTWHRYTRFWGRNIAADVDDELHFHLEMRIAEYVARGLSRADATELASRRFGNFNRAKTDCVEINEQHARSQSRSEMIATMIQDAAFALRLFKRQRVAACVAVLCLALGIGATTTMFSVANTLLLRPLPFPNGDRVVSLFSVRDGHKTTASVSSHPDFSDWRARQHAFTDLAALGQANFTIIQATPFRVTGAVVSPQLFQLLGILPEYGRFFRDDEDLPAAAPVVIVSHGLAERQFGGAAHAVGSLIDVGGNMRTIIGVVPEGLRYPAAIELWAPLERGRSTNRASRNLDVIGLLRPGVDVDAAQRDMATIGETLARENPRENAQIRVAVEPLRERYVGAARSGFAAMTAAAVLVLLVACINVAGLQLARAGTRMREISVRTALGAAHGRLLRQLLTESVLLSALGGVLGVGLAMAGERTVTRAIAGNVPSWMAVHLDFRALVFTLLVSMLVGVAFGIAPALRLTRLQPSDVLRGGKRALGRADGRLQSGFVIAQIALSVVLVVGAALAIESVLKLEHVPLGLEPRGVFTFRVATQGPRYGDPAERARAAQALDRAVAAIPGVVAAGATTYAPIAGCCSQFGTLIEGRPVAPGHELLVTGNIVIPGFFEALQIPLIQGRTFTDADDATGRVVIINRTFAAEHWPDGSALGHRIDTGNGMATIVGVVGDIKQGRLIDPPEPQFYRPHTQDPWEVMTYVVRVRTGDPARIAPDVRRALHEIDPTLAAYQLTTLETTIDNAVASNRLFGILFLSLAMIALFLAAAGVYAVISFYVSERTPEIGLRMALGAESARVVRLIVARGALLAAAGGGVGLIGGGIGARALAHQLYGVTASEPRIYLAAAAALALIALVATYGPARRASRVDPMTALRAE